MTAAAVIHMWRVLKAFSTWRSLGGARLMICRFPTESATSYLLRRHETVWKEAAPAWWRKEKWIAGALFR